MLRSHDFLVVPLVVFLCSCLGQCLFFYFMTLYPTSQEMTDKYKKNFAKKMKKALPKSVMVAKVGGEEAFQQAMSAGEIFSFTDPSDGCAYYAFRTMTVGEEVGVETKTSGSKNKAVTDDELKQWHATLSSVGWDFQTENIKMGEPLPHVVVEKVKDCT